MHCVREILTLRSTQGFRVEGHAAVMNASYPLPLGYGHFAGERGQDRRRREENVDSL
jgi:hypothetical protein